VERVQKQLASLEYWLEELSNANICSDEQMSFILIGNKSDVNGDPKYCPCERILKEWCEQQQLQHGYLIRYQRCSAKTGFGVEEAFSKLCRRILATDKSRTILTTC